jgi:tetratricopeptide (TPR) repeat protein
LLRVTNLIHQAGRAEEALPAWEETRACFEGLVRDEPGEPEYQDALARCLAAEGSLLAEMGRVEEGAARLRRSLSQWQAYGALPTGRLAAYPGHRSAREAWIQSGLVLAQAENRLGRGPEALACSRQALALAGELSHEQPAKALAQLTSQLSANRPDEAIAFYRRACALIEPMAREHPSDLVLQEELGYDLFRLAALEDNLDRADEAIRDFRRSIAVVESLMRHKTLDVCSRVQLATSYHILARSLADTGRAGEALQPYRQAIAIREALHREDPENPTHRYDCGGSWHRLGEAWEKLGNSQEAYAAYQKGLAYRRPLVVQAPGELRYRKALDEQLRDLAGFLKTVGRADEAVATSRERRALRPDDPAVALGIAGKLAAASVLGRAGAPLLIVFGNHDRRRYAVEALAAARDGVRLLAAKPRGAGSRP